MRLRVLSLAVALCAAVPIAAGAQATPDPAERILVPSPVLTLDWERLYEGSLWGQRVRDDLETASAELAAENTRIADSLVAEERALTDRRPAMPPEAFRAEADAFDVRVTGIRAAQEEKARALGRRAEEERQAFIAAAVPLLDGVLEARGAVAVLDARAIIRGLALIDVTAELGARVDATLGAGGTQAASDAPADAAPDTPPDAPEPRPVPEGAAPVPPAAD